MARGPWDRPRNHDPQWRPRRHWRPRVARWRWRAQRYLRWLTRRMIVPIAAIALIFALAVWQGVFRQWPMQSQPNISGTLPKIITGPRTSNVPAALPSGQLQPSSVRVIDGDTIAVGGRTIRLVGFDTPESGNLARCARERDLAARATARLHQLVSAGGVDLQAVRCSCRPGTEGTSACNYGRACGVLRSQGRDVGPILIGEGLARPYHCGATSCPRRQSWC
jgi:endonuclease YncB( thermonuclease family)